jgi:RimJ/RimL family protein N-acetyltransferase
MRIDAVATVPAGLRERYLVSLAEPQELYVEQLVTTGRAYELSAGGDVVGYAVVADETIVELYVVDDALPAMPALFEAVLTETGATRALCKTFDARMMTAAASRPATTKTSGFLFRAIVDRSFVDDPNIRPRVGSGADVESVWAVNDEFFDDVDEVERYAADGRLFLYETAGGELLGYGILTRIIPGLDAVDVGMVVAAEHRGRGIGAHIVAHLKHHCLQAGDRPVCGCSADNHASRRALENAGFATAHSLIEFNY